MHRQSADTPDLAKERKWPTSFAGAIACGDCPKYQKDLLAQTNTDAAFAFDSLGRLIEEGQTYG